MMEHEYALMGGMNRSKVGRYISIAAASVSSVIVLVLLSAVDIARNYGLPVNLPPVLLSFAGAGTVFLVIYWLFDRYIWKWPKLSAALKVPDLSGEWHCEGQSINPDKSKGYVWAGRVTIAQSWDRIRVHLATQTSSSDSISAAILHDQIDGYRLLYHYRNNPAIGAETALASHLGFSELVFNKPLTGAAGEYFNGRGRYTFGTMKLTRIP